ncbi:Glutathione reductase [hydrothermal vent metagenome]|uniref:Glutathione reductase n=1 Tax=hydrothermal vent metagenome TaxID=652676 RepID=A0A3B0VKB6_9ZZZZ
MQYDYDLIVIGAGSGGVRSARIAAGYGKKVAIFEGDAVGGTCVIRGCVPKKLLVYAASLVKTFKAASAFGWDSKDNTFSWERLIANKDEEIKRLNKIYLNLLNNSGVKLIEHYAHFVDKNTVVANAKNYTAKRILIATGSTPFFPKINGIEHAISSNEALSLKALPAEITVMGAGYIAVEFACIFNALGVKVNLIYRGDKILRGFDMDVRNFAQESYVKNGINIILNSNIIEIKPNNNKFNLTLDSNIFLEKQDIVLCATGRVANTHNLGLENVQVNIKYNGQIQVDNDQNCGPDSLFAVGDVCNSDNLTPVAIKEGHLLMDRWYDNSATYIEYDYLPSTVFSQPEIASCGYTEEQAAEHFGKLTIFKSQFKAMKYAMTDIHEQTFMKLIVQKETDLVVGCHIVGTDAGEIIQGFAVAIKQGITKTKLNQCIGIHPTSAEELVTMR